MKILFIKPLNNLAALLYESVDIVPDIGFGYLITALRQNGFHDNTVLDCSIEHVTFGRLKKIIARGNYDIVGVKCFSVTLGNVARTLQIVKEVNPEIITLVGGAHPSGNPEGVLTELPDADFAFRGEAETGLPQLVQAIENNGADRSIPKKILKDIPGLIWRDGNGSVANQQVFIDDLDGLGFPAWDALKYDRFKGEFWLAGRYTPIFTTRGCPYHCTYCSGGKVTGHKLRYRSAKHIVDEIEYLMQTYNIHYFNIVDDNFTFNNDHVYDFCDELERRGIQIEWDAASNAVRYDTFTPELVRRMEEAGCRYLTIAVESGSQRIQDHMRRQCKVEDIPKYVDIIKNNSSKIKLHTFYIMGYPEETLEDIWKTIRLSEKLNIDFGVFFLYTPHPGSEMAGLLKEKGKLTEVNWDSCKYNRISIVPEGINPTLLKLLHIYANINLYMRPSRFISLVLTLSTPQRIWYFIRGTLFFVLES